MDNKSVKIDLGDVRDIAKRIAETGEYDVEFNAVEDIESLSENKMLSEADKCVLGLAYAFWPLKKTEVAETKRTHKFFLHDFWKSACAMESVFNRYGGIDCGFTSTAPFVKNTVDAVFVIINSMSRGFNITFDKAFGGDMHLKYLASIFAMKVCKHYFSELGVEDGIKHETHQGSYLRFKKRIDDANKGSGQQIDWTEMHTMYSNLLSWLRVRTNRALLVFCRDTTRGVIDLDGLFDGFTKSIPNTMASDHVVAIAKNAPMHIKRLERLKAMRERNIMDKNVLQSCAGKNVKSCANKASVPQKPADYDENANTDHEHRCRCGGKCHCGGHGHSEPVSAKTSQEQHGGYDYDSVVTFSFNGRKTEFRKIKGTGIFDISCSGELNDADVEMAKKLGILPFDFRITDRIGRRGFSKTAQG